MNCIRLLPDHVANQIAAGEVVERPASVVKELVENSLDAAAKHIVVEIQAGGRSLIRVTDDGAGMTRDDALLSLERHATSKIKAAQDIASISTMGFRGEALPSIASVSRMSLTTRPRDQEGTQVVINGGKIVEVKAAGSAPGTSIEVRHLFFNLPARRKFLRSEETERSHIHHYLTLAALAYPECAFTFLQDNRMIWQLPELEVEANIESKHSSLRERLRALRGGEPHLLPISFSVPLAFAAEFSRIDRQGAEQNSEQLHIWGFIGAPGVSRANREEQHLFVNRRPVENRGLNFALLEGYHTSLMKGRYPVCCLFLELHPSGVDVNIHPSKKEVKFHREHDVRTAVARAVRQTLIRFNDNSRPEDSGTAQHQPSITADLPETPLAHAARQVMPGAPGFPQWRKTTVAPSLPNDVPKASPAGASALSSSPLLTHQGGSGDTSDLPFPRQTSPADSSGCGFVRPPSSEPTPLLQVSLRVVGVVAKLYVVLESDRGLVLLDQHAAHERILFEQMLRRLEHGDAPSQRLLLPETVELSPKDSQFIKEQLPALSRLGVGLSEFGERTFLLDALPPFVNCSRARRFVLEVIDELKATGPEMNSWRLGEHAIAKTVCRHAVKANDPLTNPELENLIEDLRQCAMPYTCPHGRPTLVEFNYRELEKRFGRSQ